MNEPRAIRYFSNQENAFKACDMVRQAGFECEMIEDTFNKVTLDKVGMKRRFKIVVERREVYKIAEVLAKNIKLKR